MPRFEKGSAAAKERMAHLRSLRKKKVVGEGGCISSTYDKSTTLDQKMKKSGAKFTTSSDDDNTFKPKDFVTETPNPAFNPNSSKTKKAKTTGLGHGSSG